MIIPMIIIDMVNSLKAQFQFSFNLIIKSVDNSEPFVMGTMKSEEFNNVVHRELVKLAATHNVGSPQQLPPVPDLPEQE